jgi:Na+/proline symporter
MAVSLTDVLQGFVMLAALIGLGSPGNPHILVSLMANRIKKKGHDHIESQP